MNNIRIVKGDITKLTVDAIVNAANTSLLGGSGVDGAIHRAAGRELLAECRMLNGCKIGEAKITKGYNLDAKYIIHTVGPVYRDGNTAEADLLYNCYKNSLELAAKYKLTSIAFPCISTGIYGYPFTEACKVALSAITQSENRKQFDEILLVCFSNDNFLLYNQILDFLHSEV